VLWSWVGFFDQKNLRPTVRRTVDMAVRAGGSTEGGYFRGLAALWSEFENNFLIKCRLFSKYGSFERASKKTSFKTMLYFSGKNNFPLVPPLLENFRNPAENFLKKAAKGVPREKMENFHYYFSSKHVRIFSIFLEKSCSYRVSCVIGW
jgi:hypothetical protein